MIFTKRVKRRFPKVFCIGRNKTGTTSIGRALEQLGYKLGVQAEAELLIEDWARRDFRSIVDYCCSADAFQDIPFSLDYTYQAVDSAFPGSKFILTVRDSAEQWFSSLTAFHTKIIRKGCLPTAEDLKEFPYRYPGWLWRTHQLVYGIDEQSLYDRDLYIKHYHAHNDRVLHYFERRKDALLVLNVSQTDAMPRLCEFLEVPYRGQKMPHVNRTGAGRLSTEPLLAGGTASADTRQYDGSTKT